MSEKRGALKAGDDSANAIRKTLKEVQNLHSHLTEKKISAPVVKLRLLGKLAVLELSGWIESTIYDALLSKITDIEKEKPDSAEKPTTPAADEFSSKLGRRFSGLDYERHLRIKMGIALGLPALLRIEQNLHKNGFQKIHAMLQKLAEHRNVFAHSSYHSPGTIETIPEPSAVLADHGELIVAIAEIVDEIQAS